MTSRPYDCRWLSVVWLPIVHILGLDVVSQGTPFLGCWTPSETPMLSGTHTDVRTPAHVLIQKGSETRFEFLFLGNLWRDVTLCERSWLSNLSFWASWAVAAKIAATATSRWSVNHDLTLRFLPLALKPRAYAASWVRSANDMLGKIDRLGPPPEVLKPHPAALRRS
ncbi:hypothetical protein GE09DRAFT_281550 [Coniochaeta sp. 2T2.1]|nr:hypothetical protein GE09DRAFT_281550 [Coniochaeta sp. 2T2.1]